MKRCYFCGGAFLVERCLMCGRSDDLNHELYVKKEQAKNHNWMTGGGEGGWWLIRKHQKEGRVLQKLKKSEGGKDEKSNKDLFVEGEEAVRILWKER